MTQNDCIKCGKFKLINRNAHNSFNTVCGFNSIMCAYVVSGRSGAAAAEAAAARVPLSTDVHLQHSYGP